MLKQIFATAIMAANPKISYPVALGVAEKVIDIYDTVSDPETLWAEVNSAIANLSEGLG